MGCLIDKNSNNEIYKVELETKGTPQYQNTRGQENTPQLITKTREIIAQLTGSGLAGRVFQMSTPEILTKLKELGRDITTVPKGFAYRGDVYLNTNEMTPDTPIHEFTHQYIDTIEKNNSELFNTGMELAEAELKNKNSQIQPIIDYVKQTQPNLTGTALHKEILAELTGRRGVQLIEQLAGEKKASPIVTWIKEVWVSIKNMLGLSGMSTDKAMRLTIQEYADALAVDLLSNKELFDGAVVTSLGDIQYTLNSIINNKELKGKKDGLVSTGVLRQIASNKNIRNIDKAVLNEVLALDKFKRKKIDYLEFLREVSDRIIPLEVIESESYKSYGKENTGLEDVVGDDSTKTHIYNTPDLEHGVTGHFSGNFPDAPKILTTSDVFLQDTNREVIRLGTKFGNNVRSIKTDIKPDSEGNYNYTEEVIEKYKKEYIERFASELENFLPLEIKPLQDKFAVVRSDVALTQENLSENVLTVTSTKEKAQEYIDNIVKAKSVNKGMFGHTRVWKDNEGNTYVAEIQSDSYQKMRAKELLWQSYQNDASTMNEKQRELMEQWKAADAIYETKGVTGRLIKMAEETVPDGERIGVKIQSNVLITKQSSGYFVLQDEKVILSNGSFEEALDTVDKLKLSAISRRAFGIGVLKEAVKLAKEAPILKQKVFDLASLKDKQFLAHEKNYTERLLREEIKRAANEGQKTVSIPSPRTLALIEGYIEDEGNAPYTIENAADPNYLGLGDSVNYLGDTYIVVDSDSETIEITLDSVEEAHSVDFISEVIEDLVSQDSDELLDGLPEGLEIGDNITEEQWEATAKPKSLEGDISDYLEQNEDGTYVLDDYEKHIQDYWEDVYPSAADYLHGINGWVREAGDRVYWSESFLSTERLRQPDEYEATDIEDFDINNMSESEQTVLKKYSKLIKSFKKGRTDVVVFNDDKGNEWYRTQVTDKDRSEPIALQNTANKQLSTVAVERNNGNPMSQTPNGEPSILYKSILSLPDVNGDTNKADQIKAQTYSDKFIGWFGDWINKKDSSKVVDENGEPLMVFHGSNVDIQAFDTTKTSDGVLHFGTRKAAEDRLSDLYMDNTPTYVIPTFLNIRGLQRTTDQFQVGQETYISEIIQDAKQDIDNEIRALKNTTQTPEVVAQIKKLENAEFIDEVQVEGFVYSNTYEDVGSDSYVVFYPNNVKSVFNTGQYSSSDNIFLSAKPKSILFDSLVGIPVVDSVEAFDAYKNVMSKEVSKRLETTSDTLLDENGEPKLFFRNQQGRVFDSYEAALGETSTGSVEAGVLLTDDVLETKTLEGTANNDVVIGENITVNNQDAFVPFLEVSVESNPETKTGFINQGIRQGKIAGKRVLRGREWVLSGRGQNESKRVFNTQLVRADAVQQKGTKAVTINKDGTFSLNFSKTGVEAFLEQINKTEDQLIQEVREGKYEALARKYDNIDLALYTIFRKRVDLESPRLPEMAPKREQDLRLKLMNVLKELGVSVIGMTEYLEKYKVKFGKDLSVEALADIANKVVAITEGKDTIDNLTEEVAHFIIEAMDQNVVQELLVDIEATPEWAEFSEKYRKAYSTLYSGAKLEQAVAREVLGKILMRRILAQANEQATEKQDTLLQRVLAFFSKLRERFLPSHRERVDAVLNKVAESVLEGNINKILDPSLLDNSTFKLFSLSDKTVIAKLNQATSVLEAEIIRLKKQQSPEAGKLQSTVNKIKDSIDTAAGQIVLLDKWKAVNGLTAVIKQRVKKTQRTLEKYNADGTGFFSQEEALSYGSLMGELIPTLQSFIPIVQELEAVPQVDKNKKATEMQEVVNQASALVPMYQKMIPQDYNNAFKKYIEMYNFTEEQQEKFEKMLDRDMKDISTFQKWFGSLEHASNIYLKVLGQIISKGNFQASTNYLRDIKALRKLTTDNNLNVEDFEKLVERYDNGELTGFLESYIKWGEFRANEIQAELEAYNKSLGLSITLKQYKKGRVDRTLKSMEDFTKDQRLVYEAEMQKWEEENTEQRYSKSFYTRMEATYKEAGISEDSPTREFLRNLSANRRKVLNPYLKELAPDERLDMRKVSISDRQELDSIAQQRKSAKQGIDAETGEPKTGELQRIHEELTRLDAISVKGPNTFSTSAEFYTTLANIEATEGSGAAVDFLLSNGGITFSDSFWQELTEQESFQDRLKSAIELLEQEDKDDATELVEVIVELNQKKMAILKQYQLPNSPAEIDTDNMESVVRDVLLDIETQLEENFTKVNAILKSSRQEQVVPTETTTNNAYLRDLVDSGMNELDFLKKHSTKRSNESVTNLNSNLIKIRDRSSNPSRAAKLALSRISGEVVETTEQAQDVISQYGVEPVLVEYAKTKTLSYYKRFAPQGYDAYMRKLKTGGMSVSQAVQDIEAKKAGISSVLKIQTAYTWKQDEQEEQNANPMFDKHFEGGRRQPKIDKYLNKDFFAKYGLSESQFRENLKNNVPTKFIATQNQQQFSLMETLVDLKKKSLQAYGEVGIRNIYELPQISAQTLQKAMRVVGGAKDLNPKTSIETLKNAVKDIVFNRVDDLGAGEQVDGVDARDYGVRILPKYYLNRLEEQSDVSTDLMFSYGMLLQAAYVYEQREETISEVIMFEQRMLNDPKWGSKTTNEIKNTNAYTMYKEAVDSYFFGIKRSRKAELTLPNGKKIDVSKLAIFFDRWVRAVNIGFSIPVALTSMTSAQVFLQIENVVGEHLNMNSSTWASKEFVKLAPKFMTEVGQVNRDNKLFLLGERVGIYQADDTLANAGFNRVARLSHNIHYAFSEVANFPIAPRIMLSVLDDLRLVNGKFVTYNQFEKSADITGRPKKEKIEEWNKFREKSMYNLLEERDGTMGFSEATEALYGKESLNDALFRATTKITSINKNIDAVVPMDDKSAATRDFMLNFTTAHRGWLTIALQRRFQSNSFNARTGQFEEGHYVSLANYFSNLFTLAKENDARGFLTAVREEWPKMDDLQKRNLKRVMWELGSFMFMLILGKLVFAVADDEDNKDIWPLQFLAYIYARTTNELGSVQIAGSLGLIDVAKTPFVAVNTLSQIADLKGWSFEEVERGPYAGHSKIYKTLSKQSWLRHYYQMKGVRQTSDYYRLMNSETLVTMQK